MTAGVPSAAVTPSDFDRAFPPRFVDLPGVRMLYRDTGGHGAAVVMLHANTGTSESWEPQFAAFRAAGHRLIAFDRRFRGGSTPAPDTGPQPGSLSEDLHNLLDHLDVRDVVLVGVAGGGFHVLDYAAWQPDRVRGIVIAASNGRISEDEVQRAIAILKVPCIGDEDHQYLELSPTYRLTQPDGTRRWIEIEHKARGGAQDILQPLRVPNTYAKLATIRCPALVLSGCADMLAPPALMKLWVRHLRDAEFVELPTVGHALTWERPDIFNDRALAFIARLRPPAAQAPS